MYFVYNLFLASSFYFFFLLFFLTLGDRQWRLKKIKVKSLLLSEYAIYIILWYNYWTYWYIECCISIKGFLQIYPHRGNPSLTTWMVAFLCIELVHQFTDDHQIHPLNTISSFCESWLLEIVYFIYFVLCLMVIILFQEGGKKLQLTPLS